MDPQPMSELVKAVADARAAYDAMRVAMTPEQLAAEHVSEAGESQKRRDGASAAMHIASGRLTPPAHVWACANAPELPDRVKLSGAKEWACAPPNTPFVLIMGPTGSGKTSLACAALRTAELLRWHVELHRYTGEDGCARPFFRSHAYFATAHRLGVCRIQNKAGLGEAPEVERAMSCSWLILDDIGSERDTANTAIPDVVFERYDRSATTWITTGLDFGQIGARYGDGFLRRLLDRSTIVRLGAPK